ncbi:MAG: peptidoglycan-binding domain-containing protein, partial [Candidatus Taylorbacteria bacterium]
MKKNITLNILSVFMLICIFGMGLKVVNAESYTFPNDLYVGASGQDVSNMQTQLINLGFDISSISSGATSKGYFGQQTKDALIRYQTANSIPATGFFGPLTRGRWNGG